MTNLILTNKNMWIVELVAICGVSCFGLIILTLSLLTNDYNPMNHFASDYGVGHFALEMNLGFLIGGIGLVAFATSIFLQNIGRISKIGASLIVIAGLILGLNAFFTTDIEGTPHTLHGIIHALGGGIFFLSSPIGILLVYYQLDKIKFLIALAAFIISVIFLVVNTSLSLNAGGLAQRIILLVIFSTIIVSSLRSFKDSSNQGKVYFKKKSTGDET